MYDDANTVDSVSDAPQISHDDALITTDIQFDIPNTIHTIREAEFILEAVDEDRQRWTDAVNAAEVDLNEVLRDYHYAQQQLALANRRAGKARWRIRKHGFGDIARPRPPRQGHRVSYYGSEFLLFYSVTFH